MNEHKQYLDFAFKLVQLAEGEIVPHFDQVEVELKADGTDVTIADRNAETVMREQIAKVYPQHGILGEEFGNSNVGRSHVWVVDPIDGTAYFTAGVPLFGTLVALLEDGEPVVGVIHLPMLNETIFARKDSGCWFRSSRLAEPRRATVSNCTEIAMATVSAAGVAKTEFQSIDGRSYSLARLVRSARKFRFFGDCYQHSLLCRGNIDVAVDTIMKPWDVAALIPCITEAGGVVSSMDGEFDEVVFKDSILSSANSRIHDEALRLVSEIRAVDE